MRRYNITENCDQFPIKKISSNKNEKLRIKFMKVLCLDSMFGIVALIPFIFLTKKIREANNAPFSLVLKKS